MSIKSSRDSARGSFTILRALTAASLFATGAAKPIGGSTDTDFLSLPSGKQAAVPIIDVDDTLTLHRLDMQQVTTLQRKIGDSDLASSCPSLGDRTNLYVEIKPSGGPDSIDCFLVKDLDKVIHRLQTLGVNIDTIVADQLRLVLTPDQKFLLVAEEKGFWQQEYVALPPTSKFGMPILLITIGGGIIYWGARCCVRWFRNPATERLEMEATEMDDLSVPAEVAEAQALTLRS